MDDGDLYDEFGNYIGEGEAADDESDAPSPEDAFEQLGLDDESDDAADDDGDNGDNGDNDMRLMHIDTGPSNAVVLHEDKQYYPSAHDVYGPDVEVLVQEEDAQPLSQPIIAPVVHKKFTVQEADLPPVHFRRDFLADLMNFPEQVRNVALAGQLHHGKTAFMDMLVMETHDLQDRLDQRKGRRTDEQLRYTDVHTIERKRGISIKAAPMTLVLPDGSGKSQLLNIIDTPGHVDFIDEVAVSLRLVDAVVLVVDVVEGVQINTERVIKHAMLEDLPLVLVVNKIDRLILEMRLPVTDAYFKMYNVIEQVNTVIENTIPGQGATRRVSPEKGNVAFASSTMRWCFTLPSYAKYYVDAGEQKRMEQSRGAKLLPGFGKEKKPTDLHQFVLRLWGDVFYNPELRKFHRKGVYDNSKRSFEHWILEPIYKLYTHVISDSPEELRPKLAQMKVFLKPHQYKLDANVLLQLVCEQYFGPSTGFVDMIFYHTPSPAEGARRIVDKYYTGPLDSTLAQSMYNCDQDGPLVIQVTKMFNTPDAKSFNCLGRVMSGVAKPTTSVKILGERYTPEDEEDMTTATVTDTWIAETRYNVPTSGVPAGNWVLLGGVDTAIMKTATLVQTKLPDNEEAYIFQPIRHISECVWKLAVEPINPSELPKMLDGLRKVNKSYPLVTTKVEESGEHVILGTGELYMDCVMHDLRIMYAEMDVKISDPSTRFSETVVEVSSSKAWAKTPNQKNTITMLAEPLDPGIAEDIESGAVNIKDPVRVVGKFFEQKYGYDLLASRNIWAFGPDERGPNLLQNDTLPSEVDTKTLRSVRDTIRQGFAWATREGPLCEEPIRSTKFRLIDIKLDENPIMRGGGQIIPTARRTCYSSFLLASPRLMEPIYNVSMLGGADTKASLYSILAKRRGHVLSDEPVGGTPFYRLQGLLPVIDSFGFETDLRIQAQGQCTVSLVFDRWSVVPGDPLDKSIKLTPLQPAGALALARDFVLKTRRRKGLSEDVGFGKFLDAGLARELREKGVLDE
ncbi:P-loop containing nucleoside triphosphate hydrolase protein [Amniculicola lignicola CBS 123094]|uniref:P-loop containing nucleoside triphosphate hydrolase protein n=1 Tax=Amniculicola lignicola CBS 123094 TaxID=1392246 RepID=A0A6A5W0Z3_9PLEO|nr:P-loop containing nucleoside triphosphate hydrolase protein [Amniculicola lignicola CBS 123094]